ncbi:hypothetical protein JYG23_06235 [Sedimentibacter sp. zth1]|uniref:NAD(P)/FAD-dependent oxidoreductase n=1 Tax=Sedimentibacter sp. zth1 TaxID=2816908 RepID=UPI001A93351F|nr:hypothetical protein [Sedimentibacter sp. zth1]QSX06983.1 hypothetical protein JYG23_06235 [Sedimentibacter sp. zth1]
MLRIQQIKLPVDHSEKDLKAKIASTLKISEDIIKSIEIFRKSIDARKKDKILFIYTVDIELNEEIKIPKKNTSVTVVEPFLYNVEITGETELKNKPVIVGSGPAGLFCGLLLAEKGYKPIIIERGKMVEERVKDIEKFWSVGILNERSNIQFGEGGAGTFSDGKLNTLIKDRSKRGKKVLEEFIKAGAPSEIRYLNKPHIGTDILRNILVNIRKRIIELGGTFRFEERVLDICSKDNKLTRLITQNDILDANVAIFAIGHSARDTFEMLNESVTLEQKAFAIGVRIEHPQSMIDEAQYGEMANNPKLGSADYKFVHKCKNGRSVYTFCMCPGGMVTGAASEAEGVVTNGMSYHDRDLENANSALIVTVNPEDFDSDSPLAGIEFQRKYERLAYKIAGSNYNAPAQLFGDFANNVLSKSFGKIYPTYRPGVVFANLRECLPNYVCESLVEGINAFGNYIEGYNRKDAILTGVETRTSSPIRIIRDENFESSIKGIYPCGEGAGYAGGIMSAAIDGLKVAESIMKKYKPAK